MAFTERQTKALSAKLNSRHIRKRTREGFTLSYIEGWHAIAEANRVFGFDAWDRQTISSKCIWEGSRHRQYACSYVARVRIRVRAGDIIVCREGSGSGHGSGEIPGEAHESALKEAETDAMKRALATFGNPFGLALYDKEQRGVRFQKSSETQRQVIWALYDEKGEKIGTHDEPFDFCKAAREYLERIDDASRLTAFWNWNRDTVAQLRQQLPELKTSKGQHYSEILGNLFTSRLQEFASKEIEKCGIGGAAAASAFQMEASGGTPARTSSQSRPVPEPHVTVENENHGATSVSAQDVARATASPQTNLHPDLDRNAEPSDHSHEQQHGVGAAEEQTQQLLLPRPSRIRDKEHLKFVAKQTCLVCGRFPSQVHHVRIAELRAMGRKVSDSWTVPLCAFHHRELHDAGDEKRWWTNRKLNPIAAAADLWTRNRETKLVS